MRYTVRAFHPVPGEVLEHSVDAASVADARAHSFGDGAVVLSVAKEKSLERAGTLSWRREAALDVGWWCQELRTLLVAGMTVVEAIETLEAQSAGGVRARVNASLLRELRRGAALSSAMAAAGAFPAILVAGVKASERTSSLVDALEQFLAYQSVLEGLRKQTVSAAIYPGVVLVLGVVIALFLLLFVIPRFSQMYGDATAIESWATRGLLWISRAMNAHGGAFAFGLAAMAGALAWAWRQGHAGRVAARVVERIRPLQAEIDQFRLAKLYHSVALMFRGGYTLDEALSHCAALGMGPRLSAGIHLATARLARGERVSTAFAAAGLTDEVSRRLLAVGERTGNFDRVLQTIAERHRSRFGTFVQRATRLVEPLLLLLVALVVGGIVVMMYMPVFDMASTIR